MVTALFDTLRCLSKKKEKESKKAAEPMLDEEDAPFQDDAKDSNYQSLRQRYT